MTEVEVDEMPDGYVSTTFGLITMGSKISLSSPGLVGHIRAKVASHNAVPRWIVSEQR